VTTKSPNSRGTKRISAQHFSSAPDKLPAKEFFKMAIATKVSPPYPPHTRIFVAAGAAAGVAVAGSLSGAVSEKWHQSEPNCAVELCQPVDLTNLPDGRDKTPRNSPATTGFTATVVTSANTVSLPQDFFTRGRR
jgi:hypothetical protein